MLMLGYELTWIKHHDHMTSLNEAAGTTAFGFLIQLLAASVFIDDSYIIEQNIIYVFSFPISSLCLVC